LYALRYQLLYIRSLFINYVAGDTKETLVGYSRY
jgi:hypothetical protein